MFGSKKLKICLIFAALIIAVSVVFARSQYVLPVAMYHSVLTEAPAGNRLIVSTGTFERQMRFLKEKRYTTLTLDQAADIVSRRTKGPGKAVVLTFDDGYEDNYIHAFPVLKKYGLRATIYLVVNDIGKPGKLGWEQILEMKNSGLIDFGSHSLSHPFLDCIVSPDELVNEISRSKKILEEKLGAGVTTFAYPCGRFNAGVRQRVAEAGYRTAVVTNPGKSVKNDDLFALKRVRISESASNLFVFWFEISGYYNFIREHRHK